MGQYFSDIHTTKESQLFGGKVTVEDSEQIKEIKEALKDYPNEVNLLIKLGFYLNRQLRYLEAIDVYSKAIEIDASSRIAFRKRGVNYLKTLNFKSAHKDFLKCKEIKDDLDIEYMLGLICYLRKMYDESLEHFEKCLSLAEDDGEMLVASIYWHYIAAYRAGKEHEREKSKKCYKSDMFVGHHTAYRTGMELFLGNIGYDEAFKIAEEFIGETKHLEFSMIGYAAANKYLEEENNEKYLRCLDEINEKDEYWAGFASIAALSDRHPEYIREKEEE